MNEKRLIDFFKDKKWEYLLIEGSSLGNTSFLTQFLKLVVLSQENTESSHLDRLLDDETKILYFRPETVDVREQEKISKMSTKALIEFIAEGEVFDSVNIIKYIQNRPYNYLIIDDNRKNYNESTPFKKFNELLYFSQERNTKIIVSVTDSRQQKIDYSYHAADLILRVTPYFLDNSYSIEVEERGVGYKMFTMSMK